MTTRDQTPATFHGSPATIGEPWLGYIRVSTWKEEKISDTLQRSAIEQWAARTGRRIVGWVIDLDATGRNFRRKIMGAIERVEAGEAVGIAVWRYSRFGRNRTGNAVNLARLEAVGGQLESATEAVDARTAVGELQREMIFAFGNFESNRAGEQWKEAHDHRRFQLGLPAQGRPRFGYVWHPRRVPDATAPGGLRLQNERYELHPDHASIVEELYERKLANEGFATLAHWINDELSIPTARGNRWAVNTVQRYLDSGFAAGLLRIHDPDCKCGFGKEHWSRCKQDRMLFIPGAQPAIVTPDQWKEYGAHRELVKKTPPRARRATYTTTGLMRHDHCRGTVVARSGRGPNGEQVRGHTFVCFNHKNKGKSECAPGLYVRRDEVEAEVFTWLEKNAADGIDTAPSVPHQRTAPADPRAKAAEERAYTVAEIAKVDQALDRLVTDHAMDPEKYPADSFVRVRDQFMGKKRDLQKHLQTLADVEATPTREQFRPLMVGLLEEWKKSIDPVEKNAILRQLLRRIVIRSRKSEQGAKWKLEREYEFHPAWEPDPWDTDS
ncbi:recombinase family protein [Streptomyces sp. NPDC052069]|uniref:recombinase family protein n=1 Tax=Streptomyces sp. NPDC052069 TaxID=3154650 RepID=UPI00343212F6